MNAPGLPPAPVLARSLANELDKIAAPFGLVWDDHHLIDEVTIQDLLNELLRHHPWNFCISTTKENGRLC